MKTCQQIRSSLQVYLEGLMSINWVVNGAISHFGQCDIDDDAWDAPTLWIEVSIEYAWMWSTPTGLVEVSEETSENGVMFGYQLANVQ